MKKKFTIETVQEKLPRRKDSFWYDGQVAIVSDGKRKISVEATGHTQVSFKENGETFENDMARKEAMSLGKTDRSLKNFNWDNNNWFTLYDLTGKEPKWIADTVADDYDEAIQMAKNELEK